MIKSPLYSYSVFKCIEAGPVSEKVMTDLKKFYEFVDNQTSTASKHTHYYDLDKWSDLIFSYVNKMLNKYKFVNGGRAMGIEQNPEANFWWMIYSVVSNVIYSPHLKTTVVSHHSSAFERNEALKLEITDIINGLNK